jgi:hypothetical protein
MKFVWTFMDDPLTKSLYLLLKLKRLIFLENNSSISYCVTFIYKNLKICFALYKIMELCDFKSINWIVNFMRSFLKIIEDVCKLWNVRSFSNLLRITLNFNLKGFSHVEVLCLYNWKFLQKITGFFCFYCISEMSVSYRKKGGGGNIKKLRIIIYRRLNVK